MKDSPGNGTIHILTTQCQYPDCITVLWDDTTKEN